MSRTRIFLAAGMATLLSVMLIIYGMWLWIIQANGDGAYHWAALAAIAAIVLLLWGAIKR